VRAPARQAVDMMKRTFKGMLKEGDRVLPPRIHPGVYALLLSKAVVKILAWLQFTCLTEFFLRVSILVCVLCNSVYLFFYSLLALRSRSSSICI
jgi:hypothetical protein